MKQKIVFNGLDERATLLGMMQGCPYVMNRVRLSCNELSNLRNAH